MSQFGSFCLFTLATFAWGWSGDGQKPVLPTNAVRAGGEPSGGLALEACVEGIEGHPADTSIQFWRSIEEPAKAEGEPNPSWRTQLNPPGIWTDRAHGKAWEPLCGFRVGDYATATKLAPGDYRVTAWRHPAVALGLSEVVHLDGGSRRTSVVIRLQDGPSLTVMAVEETSGKPIDGAQALLVRDDGLPVTDWGGWPWARWMANGRLFVEHLAPGAYLLTVGRIPWEFGEQDYAPSQSPIRVVLSEGKDETITVRLKAVEPTPKETEERWPFAVTGRVADASGKGMEGVAITAHCGMGTLIQGGRAVSGPDGRYTVRFASTGRFGCVAIIAPQRPGFFERNLHRQGDLFTAWTNALPSRNWPYQPSQRVLPHQPHIVDFVMLPAAIVSGRLLDERGDPIARCQVSVSGPRLPPGSSVFAHTETDSAGRFHFDSLPTGYTCRFELARGVAIETQFEEPGPQLILLRTSRDPEGRFRDLVLRRSNEPLPPESKSAGP